MVLSGKQYTGESAEITFRLSKPKAKKIIKELAELYDIELCPDKRISKEAKT